jgi:hypothetical protein
VLESQKVSCGEQIELSYLGMILKVNPLSFVTCCGTTEPLAHKEFPPERSRDGLFYRTSLLEIMFLVLLICAEELHLPIFFLFVCHRRMDLLINLITLNLWIILL